VRGRECTRWHLHGSSRAPACLGHPEGAQVSLAEPNAAVTRVDGLSVPGGYAFRLEVSGPSHTVTVDHTVPVYR
jgi:hypothetical protein